jgi:hypothetical protein
MAFMTAGGLLAFIAFIERRRSSARSALGFLLRRAYPSADLLPGMAQDKTARQQQQEGRDKTGTQDAEHKFETDFL